MSEHLSAERLAYLRRVVEDEGGMDYEEENLVLAHIDAQAAIIQRVWDICMDTDGNYLGNEAECSTVGDIIAALNGGGS